MFDWLGDIFSGIGNAISGTIDVLGTEIANEIFDAMLQWFYEIVYNAVADFFTMMGNMGADIFDLAWVQATIALFFTLHLLCGFGLVSRGFRAFLPLPRPLTL